ESCHLRQLPTRRYILIMSHGDSMPGLEHPPSPDYVPGLEHPPSPDYVPGPEYPEYLVPSDDEDPYEDPGEDPADGRNDDDDEEEEDE
ncbi:hypothetical protein Tco_1308715, partial [Tanacetum coccineum]